ncbi:MAG: two component transcriptional regulator, winged helix family [Deltaproteobacteria bacterium]|jgi:two-component system OmpR family response regulator/two-component system response regulator QseB|nr:two component transcriptional regulator, winged helix family [Deltaproteobacteria bacterium]
METKRVPAGKRVAIIEDDIPLREALILFLRVKGWTVDTFGSGEETAGVANWGEYAVVICDLYLPREDGLSLLRRVREASDEVVTVLVTAYPGNDIPAQAASAGVDRYLYKPFSTMELVESLGALTEKRAGRRALELTSI